MAEPDRPIAHSVLDVAVAIDVEHVAALAALDEARRQHGILVVALGIGVAAARDDPVRALLETDGFVESGKLLGHRFVLRLTGSVHARPGFGFSQ